MHFSWDYSTKTIIVPKHLVSAPWSKCQISEKCKNSFYFFFYLQARKCPNAEIHWLVHKNAYDVCLGWWLLGWVDYWGGWIIVGGWVGVGGGGCVNSNFLRGWYRISDPDMHHGTCMTHVPWCMPGSLISDFLWSRWRGKRSRYSRRMCNTIFYVSGKRPMAYPFSRNINLPPTSDIWRSLIPLPVTVVLNILLGGWVGGGGGRGLCKWQFLARLISG